MIKSPNTAQYEAIRPKNTVDDQLGFSSDTRRLGITSMIEDIPYDHTGSHSLPIKELPRDLFAPFGQNKRCFPFLLSNQPLTKYSVVDDLHHIDAILETQNPLYRDFTAAN
jgi:hypothetical protein